MPAHRVRAVLLVLLVGLANKRTAQVYGKKGMGAGMGAPKLDRVDLIVSLNGEPKSGTSWLEMVVKNIAQLACSSENSNDCTFMRRGREFRIYWDDGRVGLVQHGASCITHKNGGKGCAGSKHNIFPICADDGGHGLHHAPSIAEGCSVADGVRGCPCWIHPPPVNGTKHAFDTHRNALEKCAARIFHPGRACAGSAVPRELEPHGIEERFLLIARDPRDVVISEHFYKSGSTTNLATKVRRRVPLIGSWTALRYFLAKQYNAEVAKHRPAPLAATETEPFLVVLYNSLRTSLEPYRKICKLMNFTHCSDGMLRQAKDAKSAETLREHKGDGEDAKWEHKFSKVRSAGKKDLGDYGLPVELLEEMAEFTLQVLPQQLAADLVAGSDDWVTHKLHTASSDDQDVSTGGR